MKKKNKERNEGSNRDSSQFHRVSVVLQNLQEEQQVPLCRFLC
jgi:hypothetical protein